MRVVLAHAFLLAITACEPAKGQPEGDSPDDSGDDSAPPEDSGDDSAAPSGCAPREDGWVTDLGTYDPPEPAALAAGESAVDPTFGARVLRVTDTSSDPTGCLHSYSYWPTINADSSRLILYCYATGLLLYDFDREGFAATARGPLFSDRPEGGGLPSWGDVFWSTSDPDRLYAHDGARLYAYDVQSSTFELLRDLSEEIGSNAALKQMSMSEDDDVFAWHIQDYDTAMQGWLVYRRSTDEVLAQAADQRVDEVQVDKGGDFLVVKTGQQGAGAIEVQVVDLATGAVEDLTDDDPDYAPGHSDNGFGFVIGADNWNNRVTRRELSSPHDAQTILSFGSDWSFDYHVSLRARDEDWALLSLYAAGERTSGLFHEEILQVATDGSGAVRRLAHHQTVYADYWTSPRANLSADGCFVTFTSTWGDSGRTDVFLASLAE